MVRMESMTTSDERTLGILLAKVEAIQDTLSRAEQSRANMHRRLDEVVKEVGDLKTDVESMRGTVAASKEITDEVKAWKQRGIGALAIVGFGASGLTFIIQHYFDQIAAWFRG